MQNKFLSIFILFFFGAYQASASCTAQQTKNWAVLIYMAADNNLTPYALLDLHEMEAQHQGKFNLGSSDDDVTVLVEVDTLGDEGIRRLKMFQYDFPYQDQYMAKDFSKRGFSGIKSPILEVLPEGINEKSSKERLQEFLSWGFANAPAKNRLVIIWGHGEGYNGTDQKSFGGIAFDESKQDFINTKDLGTILKGFHLGGFKRDIDILAFDACLMQSLEVMSEFSSSTNFIVGSHQIQNLKGFPYRDLLDEIQLNPTPFDLAKKFPQIIKSSISTSSSVASGQVKDQIYPHLENIAKELLKLLKKRGDDPLLEERDVIDEIMLELALAPRLPGETIDLGQFYAAIESLLWNISLVRDLSEKEAELKSLVAKGHSMLRAAVIGVEVGSHYYDSLSQANGYTLGYLNGLSVWFPTTRQTFHERWPLLRHNKFYQEAPSWRKLLVRLFHEEKEKALAKLLARDNYLITGFEPHPDRQGLAYLQNSQNKSILIDCASFLFGITIEDDEGKDWLYLYEDECFYIAENIYNSVQDDRNSCLLVDFEEKRWHLEEANGECPPVI